MRSNFDKNINIETNILLLRFQKMRVKHRELLSLRLFTVRMTNSVQHKKMLRHDRRIGISLFRYVSSFNRYLEQL